MSHGVASLPPSELDEDARVLTVTVPVRGAKPRTIRIREGRVGKARIEILGPAPSPRVKQGVREAVAGMLNLDEDLGPLYSVAATDPELSWIVSGAGRMFRSPTVFEDVVKTICTTNCTWSATVRMVSALVSELGENLPAGWVGRFQRPPRWRRLLKRSTGRSCAPATGALPEDARDRRRRRLARPRAASNGPTDELPDEEVVARLLALPGVGPYAAAHVMMLLGRHSLLILDSWTRPSTRV